MKFKFERNKDVTDFHGLFTLSPIGAPKEVKKNGMKSLQNAIEDGRVLRLRITDPEEAVELSKNLSAGKILAIWKTMAWSITDIALDVNMPELEVAKIIAAAHSYPELFDGRQVEDGEECTHVE